ncbi:monovalent cation/H(+) antiporter subunit G [Telluria aromaticivorans]|uniref:Cation:proton antiporter n=1 Tax=Telluria aromaticivorans TaxID=2725995 RepID=A0A7Y2K1G0_9BURK|nr:monovalent cation/H(+) antiporter subunit G [Telluria aromaticivorans]NNG24816.1 cation:proton antiporter [Telluria aromaticivorans]
MTGIEHIPGWAALPVALLLVLGATIILIGALGLLRLRTFYQRIHGPAITVTLGAGCLLLASMVYFTVAQSRLVIHEIIISVFLLMTAPVVAMTIMRAAVYRDLRARRHEAGATAGDVYSIIDGTADSPQGGRPD